MKRIISCLVLFHLLNHGVCAQSLSDRQLSIIRKNIIAYVIRYAVDGDLKVDGNGIVENEPTGFFFDNMLPDSGSLVLNVQPYRGKEVYPITALRLYHVSVPSFKYTVKSDQFRHLGEDSASYVLDFRTSFRYGGEYLVAAKDNDSSIVFISGQYFNSRIADDFNIDIAKPLSLTKYIWFKYYYLGLTEVKFLNRAGKYLIYEGVSDNARFRLSVDRENIERIKVEKCKEK